MVICPGLKCHPDHSSPVDNSENTGRLYLPQIPSQPLTICLESSWTTELFMFKILQSKFLPQISPITFWRQENHRQYSAGDAHSAPTSAIGFPSDDGRVSPNFAPGSCLQWTQLGLLRSNPSWCWAVKRIWTFLEGNVEFNQCYLSSSFLEQTSGSETRWGANKRGTPWSTNCISWGDLGRDK